MTTRHKPAILIIDDRPEESTPLQASIGKKNATVHVRTPAELEKGDLEKADLVLVDYELHGWRKPPKDLTTPSNGLALSAVLRARINYLNHGSVTGVALYSGRVKEISGTLPKELRGFAVARLNNLEWVFQKGEPNLEQAVLSLAHAIQRLPREWPEDADEAAKQLHRLLDLKVNAPFNETAADDIRACHPPIHELSSVNHALVVIRWIAHRILPYPAFLTDRPGLAARLRIDLDQLDRLLTGRSKLKAELEEARYTGVLCDLFGPHWWRSGLDQTIFRWTDGVTGADAQQDAIKKLAGKAVKFLDEEVVPAIDESYRPTSIVAVSKALRLRPDDWPPFAADAWAERSVVVDSERLRGLVLPTDMELLDDAA